MSSGERTAVSAWIRCAVAAGMIAFAAPVPLSAQDTAAPPPGAIDIKVDTTPQEEEQSDGCSAQELDAAAISGEIVVCGRRNEAENRLYSAAESRERYARETMNAGDPQAPDVAGAGIFRGPATISGLCLVPPCPAPPAYMVDFSQIPETPPGSDADRVGRGLAPLNEAASQSEADSEAAAADPPPSPTGSASPEALP